jgi:hypothetical protein
MERKIGEFPLNIGEYSNQKFLERKKELNETGQFQQTSN